MGNVGNMKDLVKKKFQPKKELSEKKTVKNILEGQNNVFLHVVLALDIEELEVRGG